MALGGDWLTPHLNGIPHFQKPPLLYWCTALSIKVFGVHAWAARLPAVFAAIATLALTAFLAQMLLGSAIGQSAILVLAASTGFFGVARLLTPDMLLTFWIIAAITCVVRRQFGGGAIWGWGFFIANDNTYQVLFGGALLFGTNAATPNVWTHLALVRASGTATLLR